MKHLCFLLILIAFVAFAGCDGREESPKTAKQDPEQAVRKDVTQAARESRQTLPQQREDYLKQGEAKLKQYDETIGKLSQRTLKQDKTRFDQEIAGLRQKHQIATNKLNEARTAPDQDWEKVKKDLDAALEDLDKDVRRVEEEYK
ncbi:MAG: sll1863 family stress response protein [Syntrophorhabdaceae bacterium]